MCVHACVCEIGEVDTSSVIVLETSVFRITSYNSFLGCKMNSVESTGIKKEEIDNIELRQNKK